MSQSLKSRVLSIFSSGSERTKIVKRNALGSVLIKVLSMVIDFAKVPVLLSYLTSDNYGVYITIASIVYWSHNFDFGLGAGLRFHLTKSISVGDEHYGKRLVSTAYISMLVALSAFFILALPIIFKLDWNSILNCQTLPSQELVWSIVVVLLLYLMQFVLELLTYVLQADQKVAYSTIFKPIANVLTLLAVLALKLFSYNSLFLACMAMSAPLLIVLLIANIKMYRTDYKRYKPSVADFDKKCLKDIYSLGVKFFIGQFAGLVVFNSSSIIISHFINPTETAIYNSAWTYFGVLVIFNNMLLQPIITAVTDAYVKRELDWIKGAFGKLRLYNVGLTIVSVLMLLVSPFVFNIWLGGKLLIPLSLSIVMSIYFILNIWVSPYWAFLSGVGKLDISLLLALFKIVAFIPAALLMIKKFDTVGMVVAIIIINTLPNFIFGIIQYRKIVNDKARGIWNK